MCQSYSSARSEDKTDTNQTNDCNPRNRLIQLYFTRSYIRRFGTYAMTEVCPDCGATPETGHTDKCVADHKKDPYLFTDKPLAVNTIHEDFAYEVKVSNDNTKGEKRVTVHVRSDSNPEDAQKLADKLYKDELES